MRLLTAAYYWAYVLKGSHCYRCLDLFPAPSQTRLCCCFSCIDLWPQCVNVCYFRISVSIHQIYRIPPKVVSKYTHIGCSAIHYNLEYYKRIYTSSKWIVYTNWKEIKPAFICDNGSLSGHMMMVMRAVKFHHSPSNIDVRRVWLGLDFPTSETPGSLTANTNTTSVAFQLFTI